MDILQIYDNYWNENAHPITSNWVLIDSAGYLTLTILLYLYLVLNFGPRYMKHRKPYTLKIYINCYNVFQILINAYIVKQFLERFTIETMFFYVEKGIFSEEDLDSVANTMWLVTLIKLIDLSETVVYVLRKKDRQISFLHVYHHVTTLLLAWYATKYYPYPSLAFTMLVNCCVHVIMYTYYFISALDDIPQKLIKPIKPFITILQMVQFVILITQYVTNGITGTGLWKVVFIGLCNMVINFTLFLNFYRKSYVKSPQKKN